jgi:hypothetical protein
MTHGLLRMLKIIQILRLEFLIKQLQVFSLEITKSLGRTIQNTESCRLLFYQVDLGGDGSIDLQGGLYR